MELIRKIRHKVGYVWYWRVRHWWMDTRDGLIAKISLAIMALIVVIAATVFEIVESLRPPRPQQPHEAVVWFVVYLIVALVIAAIAIATMPKPKGPSPTQGTSPTTQDGQTVVDFWGTCWFDDSFILAWKQMGTEAIQSDGGKK